MSKENNSSDRSDLGYRPMSYEEAANVRRKSYFDRENVRDGADSGGTRPYNAFTGLGDRPKQRRVGQIIVLISAVAFLMTFLTFLTAEDGDYKILSMERTEGVVDSILFVPENDKTLSTVVMISYTYDGETYKEQVSLPERVNVGDTVTVYVKKNDPTEVTSAGYMPIRLSDTAKGFYFLEAFVFMIGAINIAYSYEHIRVQLREINAKSNEAKARAMGLRS